MTSLKAVFIFYICNDDWAGQLNISHYANYKEIWYNFIITSGNPVDLALIFLW